MMSPGFAYRSPLVVVLHLVEVVGRQVEPLKTESADRPDLDGQPEEMVAQLAFQIERDHLAVGPRFVHVAEIGERAVRVRRIPIVVGQIAVNDPADRREPLDVNAPVGLLNPDLNAVPGRIQGESQHAQRRPALRRKLGRADVVGSLTAEERPEPIVDGPASRRRRRRRDHRQNVRRDGGAFFGRGIGLRRL